MPEEPVEQTLYERSLSPDFEKEFAAALSKDGQQPIAGSIEPENLPPKEEKEPESPPVDKEKPVEAAKPDAAKTEEDEPPPKGITGEAAKHWKKLKATHREAIRAREAELEKVRKEYDEFKSKPPEVKVEKPSDYDLIMKEREQMSEELKRLAIERHPKFKAHFDGQIGQAIEVAKRSVSAEDQAEVEQLLRMPDNRTRNERLEALMERVGGIASSKISAAVWKVDELQAQKDSEIRNATANYELFMKKQQEEQQQRQMESTKTFEKAMSDMAKELPVFQRKEGDEQWNTEVEQRIRAAKAYFNGNLPIETVARAAMQAAALPGVLQQSIALMEQNKALAARIKELESAGPSVETTHETQTEEPEESGDWRKDAERRAASIQFGL